MYRAFAHISLFLLAVALIFRPEGSQATIGLTFPVRVTAQLCPEYPYGGVTVSVRYTVGAGTQLFTPTINSQSINSGDNTAVFDLLLPSTAGTLPLHVVSFCTSSHGQSNTSNALNVTNCNHLALFDSDGDGIRNDLEDTNCDNFFSPGDLSNPDNLDTDGDGLRDEVERLAGTDPTNPGSSPRPRVFSGGPFDPDGDGNSNAVVWRPSNGTWYFKDFFTPGHNMAVQFGLAGDTPFVYDSPSATTNIGSIRRSGTTLNWYFNGGFVKSNNSTINSLSFGVFGDNIIPGPWEQAGVTNPAVARLYNNDWYFYIYKRDGTIAQTIWGGNGDIPMTADYDGDGLFDVAVYRPSTQHIYIIPSGGGSNVNYHFGTGTADYTVRGDITGDGIDDISFWEPLSAKFTSLTSDNGFNDTAGLAHDAQHYKELQLGLYNVHVPLPWNMQGGKVLFTVVDHSNGTRYTRANNSASNSPTALQWGLQGDSQG